MDEFRTRRLRISHATVVAYVALFVAMGGTATAVTYVVSSNSQLGPGTVSGSKPTTGKHDNIINGTVTGADVADNSLTGTDINEAKLGLVPNANALGGHHAADFGRVIPFGVSDFVPSGEFSANVQVAKIDGLTVSAGCDTIGLFAAIEFQTDSTATLNLFHVDKNLQVAEKGQAFGSTDTIIDAAEANNRIEGQAIYRRNSDGAVVVINYHVYQPTCEVIGTVTANG